MKFRMNACETSLRSHNDELAAQRLMIQQLTEAVQRLNAEKETNIDKLNDLVTLVDHRFAESQAGIQEIREVTHKRFETLSGTMTNIANEIVQKLDVINQDIGLLKRNSQAPPATSSTPPAPPSWTETPSTPTRPPAADTSSTTIFRAIAKLRTLVQSGLELFPDCRQACHLWTEQRFRLYSYWFCSPRCTTRTTHRPGERIWTSCLSLPYGISRQSFDWRRCAMGSRSRHRTSAI